MASFFWCLALVLLFQSVYVNAVLQCKTGGRDAGSTPNAPKISDVRKRPWARLVRGKWVIVKDPNSQFRTKLVGNPPLSEAGVKAQQCCDLKCRSKVVPKANLTKAPFTSVVQILLWTQNYGIYCSGTVIAPQVVLTAKHCVDDTDDQPIQGGYIMGKYTSPGVYTVTANVKRWRYFQTCLNSTVPDYAVLYLTAPTKLPVLSLAGVLTSTAKRTVSVVGFPSVTGVPFGQMTVDTISLGNLNVDGDNYFIEQLISNPGGSGGPVISSGTGPSAGQLAVATFIAWYSDQTCPATQQLLGGPAVVGSPYNVKSLVSTVL